MTAGAQTIRWGTVGTSKITAVFANTVRQTPGTSIQSVYSRDRERAHAAAHAFAASTARDNWDRFLADPNIDAVYIASPNSIHYHQALDSLRAGKHVLVEKPAVLTPRQWDDLIEEANRAKRILLEGIRTAYDPGFAALQELLPEIGPVRRVSFRYEKQSSRYAAAKSGEHTNIFDPAMAGGALMDLGVYCIHPLVRLFGSPATIQATSIDFLGTDGAGIAIASYEGMVADLSYSKITTSSTPSQISGETGTLVIDNIASPRLITVEHTNCSTTPHVVPGGRHTLAGELNRFLDLARGNGNPEEDHAHTASTLQVIASIRYPARSGPAVPIREKPFGEYVS